MTLDSRFFVPSFVLLLLVAGAPLVAQDEEEKELGWSDTAELSFVATSGNAESSSFALKNLLSRVWERADLEIDVRALRSESTTKRRYATGTIDDFELGEDTTTDLTAENYLLAAEYKREVSGRTYWFARSGWERNEFAGIRNRYVVSGGLGHRWWDRDGGHFRTFYGVSGTSQEGVLEEVGTKNYLGLRAGLDYRLRMTESSTYDNVLSVDENLDDTSDYRADWLNSISVSMNERLAIKLGLRLLYENRPALVRVPLLSPDGTPTGESVVAEAEKLDSYLTVALVLNF